MSSITTQPNSLLGRHVFYKLSDHDVREIIQKRRGAGTANASGNAPREGDEYPAIIVKDFSGTTCNLQVFLDGTDVYWATSRSEFQPETHGTWAAQSVAEGKAAISAETQYYLPRTAEWTSKTPANADAYWARTKITYEDGSISTSAPLLSVRSENSTPEPPTSGDGHRAWVPDAKGHWFKA